MRSNLVLAASERSLTVTPPLGIAALEHFAEDVFDADKMAACLSRTTYKKLMGTLQGMQPLDSDIADEVASAMKAWAVGRGATHYTHWFQPLTGGTAEKHDAFLEFQDEKAIFAFSGKMLTVGEPDASSFPSGGLRSTFEARGYTAWDPTSPAFIKRHSNGATLCIPTVFCSYHGEVLDKKTPLLRSTQALKAAVTRLMTVFGLPVEPVKVTLGAEQEYFLVDKKFYLERPDLIQAGRTLFGAPPAKHQQLEDHYFGSIPPRILAFMTDVEAELWKLGIPAKTRHNEAAPAQFELAPIFEELNLAVDHNMLVMEVLRQVANRYGLVCLLHEKPFACINGSGKHNNWSVCYGRKNLLDPGSNPQENAIFLAMLVAVIRAVDLHADLLRMASSGIGNDCRLGANEAPPAIISVFLGDQLTEVINQLEKGGVKAKATTGQALRIGVDSLPTLQADTTDRNRTSPFAFTGNKFEFRAPGSSQSCAGVNTVINTIVAESLDYIADKLEKASPKNFNGVLQGILKNEVTAHKRVLFNGDGYHVKWVQEAEKRGLPNLPTTLEAIAPLLTPENQALFAKYHVLNATEMTSRYEVFLEDYQRRLTIEAGIAREIAVNMVRPVVFKEYAKLAGVTGCRSLTMAAEELAQRLEQLDAAIQKLSAALESQECSAMRTALREIRPVVDALEGIVDNAEWPLPKYREMLFVY